MANTKRPDIKEKGGTLRLSSDGGTLRAVLPTSDIQLANEKAKVEAADVRTLKRDSDAGQSNIFTLNGVTYVSEKLLSASTGEAEVFQLSKDGRVFALKLYYEGYSPDPEVVKTLKEAAGTGVLVDILDYGTTSHCGVVRFFELMPFYSGGELTPGMMRGNAEQLKVTALAMIMALKTAHQHKILHKDIKPGNFFYTDDSHTQLVLADFGIAQMFAYRGEKFEIVSHSQTRTPIYAAPELYANTIENQFRELEIRYFDEKSDYFSLGVAILTLWSGEEPLKMGEYDLNRLKRRETGILPMPDDMPDDIKRLIMGLTTPNPVKRWAFDEFTRYIKGEKVALDGETQRASASGLNIIYSGSKDWTVTSFEDLAEYMLKDRKLAANYLYGGQISRWLADAGYPEIVAQIDELVKKTYPVNQQAAVTAATYIFDGTLPYISPKGMALHTQEEIAADMVREPGAYQKEIANRDSNLYIYFSAAGAGHFADRFVPLAKTDSVIALWRIVFTLDRSQPFPILNPATNTFRAVHTVEELLDYFATLPPYIYDNCRSPYPSLLWDEAFIMWLEYRDEALAGKIESKLKALQTRTVRTEQLYYYVLYLLDPSRPYELENSDTYKNRTAEELARRINIDYLCYYVAGRHEGYNEAYLKNVNQLMACRDNRLYFYLKSKEVYQEKLDYIEYAFDFNIKEHKNCAGPYDNDIATFKAIKALAGEALYAFVIDGQLKIVHNLDELSEIPAEDQIIELRQGKLKAWLAVQYHEDPFADLSEQYAYEDLLGDYTGRLYDIDEDDDVFDRFCDAGIEVEEGAKRCKKMLHGNRIWRGIFVIAVGLPLLLLAIVAGIWGCAHFTNPSSIWAYCIAAVPLTIGLRILQMFPKTDEWLLQPFGQKFYYKMLLHRWIVSAIYAFGFCGLCWVLESFGSGLVGRVIIVAICMLVLCWRYKLAIKDYPLMQTQYDDALNPDIIATKIEPLYYAWKGYKDGAFDSETLDRQNTYYQGIKSARYFCITRTLWSLIPMVVLFALYIPFSPLTENYIRRTDRQKWERIYGEGVTTSKDEIPTTRYFADVKKSLSVRKSPSSSAGKLGSLGPGEEVDVVSIERDWAKILYGDGFGYVSINYIKPVGQKGTKKEAAPAANNVDKVEEKETTPAAQPAKTEVAESVAPKLYTVKSNYNQIDVFSAKNTQAQFIIGSMLAGETFEILSNDGTWARIDYKGRDAYVKTALIETVEDQEL